MKGMREVLLSALLRSSCVHSFAHMSSPVSVACEGPRRKAAHRALSNVILHDPMAACLAGHTYVEAVQEELLLYGQVQGMRAVYNLMESPCIVSHWMNVQMQDLLAEGRVKQIVLLRSGMDTRAFTLQCLKDCAVYEVDEPPLLFLKKHMLQQCQDAQPPVASVRRCGAAMDNDSCMKDYWLRALRKGGWNAQMPSLFVLDGCADEYSRKALRHVLLTIKQQCCEHSAILLDTARMMDEKRRLQNWLLEMNLQDHQVQELNDKTLHGGLLSPIDPNFQNRYLVQCRL